MQRRVSVESSRGQRYGSDVFQPTDRHQRTRTLTPKMQALRNMDGESRSALLTGKRTLAQDYVCNQGETQPARRRRTTAAFDTTPRAQSEIASALSVSTQVAERVLVVIDKNLRLEEDERQRSERVLREYEEDAQVAIKSFRSEMFSTAVARAIQRKSRRKKEPLHRTAVVRNLPTRLAPRIFGTNSPFNLQCLGVL
jgi:hypothetical protein